MLQLSPQCLKALNCTFPTPAAPPQWCLPSHPLMHCYLCYQTSLSGPISPPWLPDLCLLLRSPLADHILSCIYTRQTARKATCPALPAEGEPTSRRYIWFPPLTGPRTLSVELHPRSKTGGAALPINAFTSRVSGPVVTETAIDPLPGRLISKASQSRPMGSYLPVPVSIYWYGGTRVPSMRVANHSRCPMVPGQDRNLPGRVALPASGVRKLRATYDAGSAANRPTACFSIQRAQPSTGSGPEFTEGPPHIAVQFGWFWRPGHHQSLYGYRPPAHPQRPPAGIGFPDLRGHRGVRAGRVDVWFSGGPAKGRVVQPQFDSMRARSAACAQPHTAANRSPLAAIGLTRQSSVLSEAVTAVCSIPPATARFPLSTPARGRFDVLGLPNIESLRGTRL